MAKMPSPAPMDDVYIKKTPEQIKEEQSQKAMQGKPFSWKDFILKVVCASVLLFLLFLSIPMLVFNYFKIRSKTAKDIEQKAYWQYCAFSFYLHQLGYFRTEITPLNYAKNIVDGQLGTSFTSFMNVYLKMKYTGQRISAIEAQIIEPFLKNNIKIIQSKVSFRARFNSFLRPLRSITFYNNNPTQEGF
jgi:hypothetical protein